LCLNCERIATKKFCQYCGQKQGIERLTWTTLFNDIQKRLFGFDNNFIRTVRDLTIRPHEVIQSSIDGVRIKYIGPIGYYFLTLTIYVLTISITGVDMLEAANSLSEGMNSDVSAEQLALQQKYNVFIANNIRVISFVMLPFFITGVWLVFKNKGYNFLETSVVNFYAQAHPLWLSIIAIIIVAITGEEMPLLILSGLTYLFLIIVITVYSIL